MLPKKVVHFSADLGRAQLHRAVSVDNMKIVLAADQAELHIQPPLVSNKAVISFAGYMQVHTGFPMAENPVLGKCSSYQSLRFNL